MNKLETLKAFLIESGKATPEDLKNLTTDNCFNEDYNTFEIIGNEYKVLTDEEAEKEAQENILESLWAFYADFILEHTEFYKTSSDYEDKAFIDCLREMQGRLCESANSLVKALISDLDEFVEDAIDANGRGYFISYYDGEEHEYNGLYIYRTN